MLRLLPMLLVTKIFVNGFFSSKCFIFCNQFYYFSGKNFPPRNSYLPVLNTGFHLPDAQSDECKYDGILYAVPKSRRSLEKRRKISFGYTKRMEYAQPKDNIVTCPACGDWHESHTICGQ